MECSSRITNLGGDKIEKDIDKFFGYSFNVNKHIFGKHI
jgi:hypothetical protein